MNYKLITADVMDGLAQIETESVQCIVTSPPYWGLRDYGQEGQIGLEPTIDEFIVRLVAVFAECHRVLKKDGVMWVNMGDAYGGDGQWNGGATGRLRAAEDVRVTIARNGTRPKDLLGMPRRINKVACQGMLTGAE